MQQAAIPKVAKLLWASRQIIHRLPDSRLDVGLQTWSRFLMVSHRPILQRNGKDLPNLPAILAGIALQQQASKNNRKNEVPCANDCSSLVTHWIHLQAAKGVWMPLIYIVSWVFVVWLLKPKLLSLWPIKMTLLRITPDTTSDKCFGNWGKVYPAANGTDQQVWRKES